MPDHDDAVTYRVRQVAAPGDLDWHRDDAGILVFTGTCPVCHGPSELPLLDVAPGTVPKPWGGGKQRDSGERRMHCECPITHPRNPEEFEGCGAWWPVKVPAPGPGTP
ncbi:hypothetical protein C3489_05450 [Streptomyces sp. Ru71]|uniref:hypothetical protein n=1 Tax=Streptomyces sp. Ru71 TaxID=2080746 RepID=UPI000CDD3326|nr:hypothetical protein [Streptomyces sp. Ru71]POX56488.1 hypothetical protein C3489_05450 [Streptomyces sp. Ru71]